MNRNSVTWILPAWLRGWERFWFTPMDPTLLGLIRLCCGAIALYTTFAYSFQLQEFMGVHAWADLKLMLDDARNRPTAIGYLFTDGRVGPGVALSEGDKVHVEEYLREFGEFPPGPFPRTAEEAQYLFKFRKSTGFDLRTFGLRPPRNVDEQDYLEHYIKRWGSLPPDYASSPEEAEAIDAYRATYSSDPRQLYSRGASVWSLWFHLTDPTAMAVVHGIIVFVVFLFTIGFATRVTSVMTWVGSLFYIHRNTQILFGVDTMITILLLYLMIGPSGAALSVDRLIARWWSRAKPGVVRGWYRLLGRPEPADEDIVPAPFSPQPQPSVSANFAIRLLQVHVCIIYLVAGLAKLQGTSWWNGTAVWGTLANVEFAPMQYTIYSWIMEKLSQNQAILFTIMNLGTLFTLVFEIGYAFLIWRPSTRWLFLAGAIFFHGLIGLFMGLKTFSLTMLVMNMAFLTPAEVSWVLAWFRPRMRAPLSGERTSSPLPAPEPATSTAITQGS